MREEQQSIEASEENIRSRFEEPRITEEGAVEFGECAKSALVCQI